jgi:hypothetical protein
MTETTQPDPQVVVWMREQLAEDPFASDGELLTRAAVWFGSVPLGSRGASLIAARKPSRLADIPAGRGVASLFIAPDPISREAALWFKNDTGHWHFLRWIPGPGDSPAARALWEHLAATLPHVTTEEDQ